jgi:hypothetical protein
MEFHPYAGFCRMIASGVANEINCQAWGCGRVLPSHNIHLTARFCKESVIAGLNCQRVQFAAWIAGCRMDCWVGAASAVPIFGYQTGLWCWLKSVFEGRPEKRRFTDTRQIHTLRD